MKATHSWTLCLCFVLFHFGTNVWCNRKLEKRQTVSVCTIEQFNCTNGQCIDSLLACDGHADCSDGSDETKNLCSQMFKTCPSFTFACKYGACVNQNMKCDGKVDCVDGSDEDLPECKGNGKGTTPSPDTDQSTCKNEYEYACKSGQCIDDTSICDGIRDCRDGSDETRALCKTFKCPNFAFKCKYGGCVSKESKCDGIKQCPDGSDEEKCFTSTSTVKTTTKVTSRPYVTTGPTTTQSIPKNGCVIPNVEGTRYSFNNTNENAFLPPGTLISPNMGPKSIIEESCEPGYHKVVPYRYKLCSGNGEWFPPVSEALCLKKCAPIISDSLDVKCSLNGREVDCSKPSIPGTTLTPSCKVTHSIPNGGVETPVELLCLPDGKWRGDLYTCTPNCGRPFIPNKVLILNGEKAKYGAAPWNVGIYRKNQQGLYDLICGGSLITTNLVVSAAHCFWYNDLKDKILRNDDSKYKIGVGKYDRNISVMDNEFTQIMDVGLIYLHTDYYGAPGFHANDLAIIVLTEKVGLSNVVMPACIDWANRYPVPNGSLGKVVGWGQTESGQTSNVLLEALLPYIDQSTCRNMYTTEFKFFVTSEKFCAGSKLGQGVHSGDSGAGLTFVHGIQNNALHYLTGVTSVKDPNQNDSIAVFTDVTRHIVWIRTLYTSYMYANDKTKASKAMGL